MKIWLIGDLHIGVGGDNDSRLDDYSDYYFNHLIPYMKEHVEPDDILVDLGDTTDNRSVLGLKTINVVINLFEEFSKIFNDIWVIIGNHDMMNKSDNSISSVNIIRRIPNVTIYDKPIVERLSDKSVLVVPWIEDINKQKELLKKYSVDYVFGHLEIAGCVTNSKGTKMKSENMVESKDFKKSQVYAGHIHIRQDYKNIHYVGTPYHKDRGDVGNIKGITVLDIDTGKTEFIENKYSPMFIKENIYDILDVTIGELQEKWKNNYIDLQIKGSDYANCNFEPFRNALNNCFKEFTPKCDNTEGMIDVSEDIVINESKSSGDLLNDYIDACDIENEMKEDIKKYLKDFKDKL